MPRARVTMAMAVKPGRLNRPRSPKRMFLIIESIAKRFLVFGLWSLVLEPLVVALCPSHKQRPKAKVQRPSSLVMQRNQRIYLRRATRRDVARDQCHDGQQYSYCNERQRVAFTYAEQQTLHQSHQAKCSHQTSHDPNRNHSHSLPQNHPQHVAYLSAQREANTEFMSSLSDDVSGDPVNTRCRQQQRYDTKQTEQKEIEARLRDRLADDVVHCLEIRHGHRPVYLVYDLSNCGNQPLRFDNSANHDRHSFKCVLQE